MSSYTARDVERLLSLSRSTLRSLISTGLIAPQRGPRREYRFSFQDLILLRTARTLIEAKIPTRRIRRSLASLRQSLPEAVPLTGLSISAAGDRVIVREGAERWHADSGQYLLGFDVSVAGGVLRIVDQRKPPPGSSAGTAETAGRQPPDAEAWFARGLELERADPTAALQAYERATALEPTLAAAWINRGRLLHEAGSASEAEAVYRRGLEDCGSEPLLWFNLGVLLEDMGKTSVALTAYESALAADPELADGHFNIARLYQRLDRPQQAIRHLGQYRRLTNSESR